MLYATPPALLILLPLAVVAALLLGPRVARALGAGWPVGVLLVGSVAVILAFTLVPMRPGFGPGEGLGCLVPDL